MLKRYWAEILVFGVISVVFILCMAPNMTWINTDSDGVHYVYAAKYLYPSHKSSVPLYLLLGRLFLYIPFGTEFWRMALLSVVCSVGTAVFIYLVVREHLRGEVRWRLYALIGVMVYGASALVISQSTIVETYTLSTMLAMIAYYFVIKKRYTLSAVAIGLGIATHGLILFVALPLFYFNKPMRRWTHLGILAGFSLFYLYTPLVGYFNPSPNMWGNATPMEQINDVYSTMMMLSGGLAIWDLPRRVFETVGLLGVSLGLGLVIVVWHFVKQHRLWRNQLFWVFVLCVGYFVSNLATQTYVYLLPVVAFGAVIVGIQLPKMRKYWAYAVVVVVVGMLIFNANYFDIGRTLDPELSAAKFYNEELAKVPDGNILMAYYGWQWAMIYPYNKNESRNIIPVSIDTLNSSVYQRGLVSRGINFEDNDNGDVATRQALIALSVIRLNDNVWTTRPTDVRTYGAMVIPARGNEALFDVIPFEKPAEWRFRPSNPYDMITGAIEVTEWNYVLWSNWSVLFFIEWGTFGFFAYWLTARLMARRSNQEEAKREDTRAEI